MAGILANSVSVTMASSATTADNAIAGFLAGEQITLSTYPTAGSGGVYLWGLSKPNGSRTTCLLSSTTDPAPTLTPDAEGYYVLTCNAGGTSAYVLRASVVAQSSPAQVSALLLLPISNAQVATPATGWVLYGSSTCGAVCTKDSSGNVHVVTVSP